MKMNNYILLFIHLHIFIIPDERAHTMSQEQPLINIS